MTTFQATPATARSYRLGESPFWDTERQLVLWVDATAGAVHVGHLSEGTVSEDRSIDVDETVGAVVTSARGEMLVAGAKQLYTVGLDGHITTGREIISGPKVSRLNDGVCDPRGRFLIGSLALDDRRQDESLVRIESSGETTIIDDDLTLSNGLAFSPGDAWLYSIDSKPGTVGRRDYDRVTGALGARAVFLRIDDGLPDGVCIDREGNLWIAVWGTGEVRCFSPAGERLSTVSVAAPNTSSLAFIGPDLDKLLITTASDRLSPDDLARYPDSGRLFIADVGVSGLAVHHWAGP